MSDDAVMSDDWRKDGRCSACEHFRVDFGEPPELYGHCKIYRGTGSRQSTDYACDQYKPLPGFAALTKSTDIDAVIDANIRSGNLTPSRSSTPSRRRVGVRRSAQPVVKRRPAVTERDAARGMDSLSALAGAPSLGDEGEGGFGVSMDKEALRDVILDVIENFIGIEDVDLGRKWVGGTVTIQPADPDLKPHIIPVETFFHKVVMIRDRLRVLEQKINANDGLTPPEKADLQQYISRCYGSLTTFNVLFKNKEDKFSSK